MSSVHVVKMAILLKRIETVHKCVWLEKAMMEMASRLKTLAVFFQVFALMC